MFLGFSIDAWITEFILFTRGMTRGTNYTLQ